LVTVVLIAGINYPNYSHFSQFISVLGATGSPHGLWVNYVGFIPAEILILCFVSAAFRVLPRTKINLAGLSCIAIYACSLIVSAIFPCDFECNPASPSISHQIHFASAIPAYLCAIAAIFLMSSGLKHWGVSGIFRISGYASGALAIIAFLSLNPDFNHVGAIQRSLECIIYGWLIIFGVGLSRYSNEKSNTQ